MNEPIERHQQQTQQSAAERRKHARKVVLSLLSRGDATKMQMAEAVGSSRNRVERGVRYSTYLNEVVVALQDARKIHKVKRGVYRLGPPPAVEITRDAWWRFACAPEVRA